MKYILLFLSIIVMSGCSTYKNAKYDYLYFSPNSLWKATEAGELEGIITLEWCEPDLFVYIPHATSPLTFKRKNGTNVIDTIVLDQKFYTDGGSIPQIGRAVKEWSPWNFAPAYLIHDWLFEVKHCNLAGAGSYDHLVAAKIMAEVIKTQLIMQHCNDPDQVTNHEKNTFYSIYQAVVVGSKQFWESGQCDLYDQSKNKALPVK